MTISVYEKELARMEDEVLALKTQKEHPLGTIDFYHVRASTKLGDLSFTFTDYDNTHDAWGTFYIDFSGPIIPPYAQYAMHVGDITTRINLISFTTGGFNSAMTQFSMSFLVTDNGKEPLFSEDSLLYIDVISGSPVSVSFSPEYSLW